MSSREPTHRPPPNRVITVGDLATSNLAARTLLYAPSAPALTLKQSTTHPTQPAPKEEISNQFSTAASTLPHAVPTVPKTTGQVIGTARAAPYLLPVVHPPPRRQGKPPLLPLAAHHYRPSGSCLRPIRMPWTPSQTKQDPLLPLPHRPPGLESPLEFATPRVPLRPTLMGPSGSTTRTGRHQPDGESSPLPRSQGSVGLAPVNVSQLTSFT